MDGIYPGDPNRYPNNDWLSFNGKPGYGFDSKQDPFSLLSGMNPTNVGPTSPNVDQTDPNNDYSDYDEWGNPVETNANGYITQTTLPEGTVVKGAVTALNNDGTWEWSPYSIIGPDISGGSTGSAPASGSNIMGTIGNGLRNLLGIAAAPAPNIAAQQAAIAKKQAQTMTWVAVGVVLLIIVVIIGKSAGRK